MERSCTTDCDACHLQASLLSSRVMGIIGIDLAGFFPLNPLVCWRLSFLLSLITTEFFKNTFLIWKENQEIQHVDYNDFDRT